MATCHEQTLLAIACKHISMCKFNFMEIMIRHHAVSLSESTTIFLFILGFQDYQALSGVISHHFPPLPGRNVA